LRISSSSGGVFSLLAQDILRRGGLVFGAGFDHSDWHVYHRSIDCEAELSELRGSKYVQSEMGMCFREVRDCLGAGREVLFSGTPCQIAGLERFLSLSKCALSNNLTLVEIVCHAVPSPLAWRRYLEGRIKSSCGEQGCGMDMIKQISFRSKKCGWKKFAVSLKFSNDMVYLACLDKDLFLRGFLSELYNRPSCHSCSARDLRSGADLTIADYWNVHQRFPEIDDDKGVSLVLVNTEKGDRLLSAISSAMTLQTSDYAHACKTNPAIISATKPHRRRREFFQKVQTECFDALVEKCLRLPLSKRLRHAVGRVLRRLGLRK